MTGLTTDKTRGYASELVKTFRSESACHYGGPWSGVLRNEGAARPLAQ
jgi:hypothetical protein